MPPITPTGGLSIIIHLIVNVFTFISLRLHRFLEKKFNIEKPKSIAHHMVCKRGNTKLRRGFAYSVMVIVFVVIIGTGYLVVRTGAYINKIDNLPELTKLPAVAVVN